MKVERTMKRCFLAAVSLCVLVSSPTLSQQRGAGARVLDPTGLADQLPVTRRAATASSAAKLVAAACACFNEKMLGLRIEQLVAEEDKNISTLLNNTGQAGVLYKVEVARADGESGPVYTVVGPRILRVGVGTSPLAVNTAYGNHRYWTVSPVGNEKIDLDHSFFFWFSKEGDAITSTVLSASSLVYQTARRIGDARLFEALGRADEGRALEAAASFVERTTKNNETKRKLAELRKRIEESEKRVQKIQSDLASQLERERKAAAAAMTLSLVSSVLTLGSQALTLKQQLGVDAPAGIDAAKSPAELQQIADDYAKSTHQGAVHVQTQYDSALSDQKGLRIELLQILQISKYPIEEVPELPRRQ